MHGLAQEERASKVVVDCTCDERIVHESKADINVSCTKRLISIRQQFPLQALHVIEVIFVRDLNFPALVPRQLDRLACRIRHLAVVSSFAQERVDCFKLRPPCGFSNDNDGQRNTTGDSTSTRCTLTLFRSHLGQVRCRPLFRIVVDELDPYPMCSDLRESTTCQA